MNRKSSQSAPVNPRWEYGDAVEGEKTQWGPRVDNVVAELYRDFVRLNHDGAFRNKFGPEAETALKYHLAVYFLQRPWQLERVAAGEVDSIRDPDQFVKLVKTIIAEVEADIADAASSIEKITTDEDQDDASSDSQSSSLFADDPETDEQVHPSSTHSDNSNQKSYTKGELEEAVDMLNNFLETQPEDLPDEVPVETRVTNESDNQSEQSEESEDHTETDKHDGHLQHDST